MAARAANQLAVPPDRTSFVGRERELADVRRLFEDGARVITLLGAPGMGKTRLAKKYARSVGEVPEGAPWIRFCDVSGATSLDEALRCVGSALGVPLGATATTEDAMTALTHALEHRGRALVVIDNCEHVAGQVAAAVGTWLDCSHDARFLITSREPLELEGERLLHLGGLPEPEAVALFGDRARLLQHDFAVSETVRPIVSAIVSRLDGIPLAIELAAARLGVLSPQQILDRLARRFEVLRGAPRGASSRAVTMWNAIDASYAILSEVERDAFAQCAVFRGGFSVEAAESVLDLPTHGSRVVDVLEALRRKSLLLAAESRELPGEVRLDMYECIREYARDKLGSLPHRSRIEARHRSTYLALGATWQARTRRRGAADAARHLRAEVDNFAAILQRHAEDDPAPAARAALLLDAALAHGGPLSLHLAYVEAGRAAAQRSGDRVLEARLNLALTEARRFAGQASIHEYQQLLERARAAGDARLEARVHVALAELSNIGGDTSVEEVRKHAAAARTIAVGLADRELEAAALLAEGNMHNMRYEHGQARMAYENALSLSRQVDSRHLEARVLSGLARVHHYLDCADARSCFEQALTIHGELGNLAFQSRVHSLMGAWCHDQGEYDEARAHFRTSLEIARQIGNPRLEVPPLGDLSNLDAELGHFDDALAHSRAGLEIARELRLRAWEAFGLTCRGLMEHRRGQLAQARDALLRARDAARDMGDVRTQVIALAELAAVAAQIGAVPEAEQHLAEARGLRELASDHEVSSSNEVWAGVVDVARARQTIDASARDRHLGSARARLSAARATGPGNAKAAVARWALVRNAVRILQDALESYLGAPAVGDEMERPAIGATSLAVGPSARWFRLPSGTVVDLSRYHNLRRLLQKLAEQRIEACGQPLSVHDLLAAGWPGQSIQVTSGALRVYTAVKSLRKMGLRDLLLRGDDGYLLDPAVPVTVVDEAESS